MNNVIQFRGNGDKSKSKKKRRKPVKSYDGIKYFSKLEIQLIRRTARNDAELALAKGKVTAPRVWMVIDLLTSTGVRVSEAANVRCGDVKCGYGRSELYVRDGKGSVSRTIQIPKSLKTHLRSFIKWKKDHNESTDEDDHLFMGQGSRGPWKVGAIQHVVKSLLNRLNLYSKGRSVHGLRHSYAIQLYRQERDLRAVQKQLGHKNIQTTTIYADVVAEDIQDQLNGLWR